MLQLLDASEQTHREHHGEELEKNTQEYHKGLKAPVLKLVREAETLRHFIYLKMMADTKSDSTIKCSQDFNKVG